MMKENKELMAEARASLSGNWGLAIGTFLVYIIIVASLQVIPTIGGVLGLFIAGPMAVGISMFSLSLSRGENARLEQIFEGFRNYGTVLGAYLLMILFIFLWMLLLIIPGFFTDSIGFLLLIPFTRKILFRLAFKNKPMTDIKKQDDAIDGEIIDNKKDDS